MKMTDERKEGSEERREGGKKGEREGGKDRDRGKNQGLESLKSIWWADGLKLGQKLRLTFSGMIFFLLRTKTSVLLLIFQLTI